MAKTPVQFPEFRRVGIWIRVSSEDQAQGDSPEHHEKRARFYAEQRGWDVAQVYHLEAVSGKTVMGHPEAQRMLQDVRSGNIKALIFSKLARLARNARELLEFSDIFEKAGADLISLQEAIDTSTPAGRLFYTMFAAMAQWEREEIADRISASVPIRAKLGKPLGGKPPLGYMWQDKKMVPNPATAPLRRLVYELFLEHRRKQTVARLLNAGGYRSQNGKLFTHASIEVILRDSSAKGVHRCNSRKVAPAGKGVTYKPESEWVLNPVEPIVSEELWTQCNHILDQQAAGAAPRARNPLNLFAGLLWCACGRKMYARTADPKYVCFGCRNKIAKDDLEAIFLEQIKGFLLSPEEIAQHLIQADHSIKEKEALLATQERELARVRQDMDQLYRLYLEGEVPSRGFGERYRPLEHRAEQLDDEVARLQAALDVARINHRSSDQILGEASDLYKQWPQLEHQDKRKVIESLTDKITVGKEDIQLDLAYFPSAKMLTKCANTFRVARCCATAPGSTPQYIKVAVLQSYALNVFGLVTRASLVRTRVPAPLNLSRDRSLRISGRRGQVTARDSRLRSRRDSQLSLRPGPSRLRGGEGNTLPGGTLKQCRGAG